MYRRSPRRPFHHLGATASVLLLVVGAVVAGAGRGPEPAAAAVAHGNGFAATVLGWSSWYGSYGLGELGQGWCIDHGRYAPDAAFGYVPTAVPELDDDTKAAISWIVTTHAWADGVTAAAVMLAAHDLAGARYPAGRLDVDHLTTAQLAGFGGHEAEVIAKARQVKADGRAHAGHRPPYRLVLDAPFVRPGSHGELRATLTDGAGRPVSGVPVVLTASPAALAGSVAVTGDGGVAAAAYVAGHGAHTFTATASVPDPALRAYGAARAWAQRIALPARTTVQASAGYVPTTSTAPATTATTPPPTTSTTRPPTTTATTTPTTTVPSTTTTTPPTTTPPPTTSTTRPPTSTSTTATTTPTTTVPPTTATTARPTTTTTPPTTSGAPSTTTTVPGPAPPGTGPPASAPPTTTVDGPPSLPPDTSPPGTSPPGGSTPATPVRGSLPLTGSRSTGLALVGAGLLLLGSSLVRRRTARRGPAPAPLRRERE